MSDHRRARRPARRRPAEGRRRADRPDDRHVRDASPILAALDPPRPHRRGPVHRHGAARHAGGDAGQPGAATTSSAARRRSAGATRTPNIVPYQVFALRRRRTSSLAVGNDGQFAKFCRSRRPAGAGGRPALCHQPAARAQPRRAGAAAGRAWSAHAHRDEWIALLEAAGVPCGPINDIGQVFDDPQVKARGMARRAAASAAGDGARWCAAR